LNGILFKPDMIQAIIEGRKTVTRRVIKQLTPEFEWEVIDVGEPIIMAKDGIGGCIFLKKRYQVGETVYIKEAWWSPPFNRNRDIVAYRSIVADACGEEAAKRNIWKSPLFMPAWAARYFIEIKDNKPELFYLAYLSDEDIEREGGELALELLEKINNLWVWRNEFEKTTADSTV